MESHRNNYGSVWKRRAVKLLAAFFVVYALLDISVLQAYCGNETLGIPPYAAQPRVESEIPSPDAVAVDDGVARVSESPNERRPSETPDSDDSCFCCRSHTTLTINSLAPVAKRPADQITSVPNFSNKNLHPDSHPSSPYQPPKFS